jgi:anti-anti-sigma regulatory factor
MQEFVMFNSTVTGKKNAGTLILKGNLTLENSPRIKEALMDVISRFKETVVRIEEMDQIDFSCFQLFCAAHKSAVEKKKAIVLIPPIDKSAHFLQLLAYSGFVPHFSDGSDSDHVEQDTRGFIVREVE